MSFHACGFQFHSRFIGYWSNTHTLLPQISIVILCPPQTGDIFKYFLITLEMLIYTYTFYIVYYIILDLYNSVVKILLLLLLIQEWWQKTGYSWVIRDKGLCFSGHNNQYDHKYIFVVPLNNRVMWGARNPKNAVGLDQSLEMQGKSTAVFDKALKLVASEIQAGPSASWS